MKSVRVVIEKRSSAWWDFCQLLFFHFDYLFLLHFGIVCNICHVQASGSILCLPPPGVLEDGLSSNGVPRSTVPGGIPNPEKKTNCETQCPNPQSLSSGPLTQKQNGLQTTEVGLQPQNQLGTGEWGQSLLQGRATQQLCPGRDQGWLTLAIKSLYPTHVKIAANPTPKPCLEGCCFLFPCVCLLRYNFIQGSSFLWPLSPCWWWGLCWLEEPVLGQAAGQSQGLAGWRVGRGRKEKTRVVGNKPGILLRPSNQVGNGRAPKGGSHSRMWWQYHPQTVGRGRAVMSLDMAGILSFLQGLFLGSSSYGYRRGSPEWTLSVGWAQASAVSSSSTQFLLLTSLSSLCPTPFKIHCLPYAPSPFYPILLSKWYWTRLILSVHSKPITVTMSFAKEKVYSWGSQVRRQKNRSQICLHKDRV